MPSLKDPNSSVNVGAGRLPAGTVPANAMLFVAVGTGGGTVPVFGADLAGSTPTHQWVGAISGTGGAGGTVPLNITALAFGATQTAPQITQTVSATTNGQNLTISAQAAGGTNHNGGTLTLVGGAATGIGTAGGVLLSNATSAAQFGVGTGGLNNSLTALGSQLNLFLPTMQFDGSESSPTIIQTQLVGTGASAGQTMSFQAQQGQNVGAGPNNAGGALALTSGAPGTGGTGGAVGAITLNLGGSIPALNVTATGTTASTALMQLGIPLVEWLSAISTPTITQLQLGGTGATIGQTLILRAQQGQNVAAGPNNLGGEILLQSGAPGTGGTGGAPGQIVMNLGGTIPAITLTATTTSSTSGVATLGVPVLEFDPSFASPKVNQHIASSGPGQTLTVAAQAAAITGTVKGGDLQLSGGVGGATAGNGGNVILAPGLAPGSGNTGIVTVGTNADNNPQGGSNLLSFGESSMIASPYAGNFIWSPFDEGGLVLNGRGDPSNSPVLPGTLNVSASTNVPTTSDLRTFVPLNTAITFASQPSVSYIVQAVSAIAITLTTPYSGTANPTTTAFLLDALSTTFALVNGNATVNTGNSQVGIIHPGSTISFPQQSGVNYVVSTVSGGNIVLSTAYTGTSNAAAAGWLFGTTYDVFAPPSRGSKYMQQGIIYRATVYGRTTSTSATQLWNGTLPFTPLNGGTVHVRVHASAVDTTTASGSGAGGTMIIDWSYYVDGSNNMQAMTWDSAYYVPANGSTNVNNPIAHVLGAWGFTGGAGVILQGVGSPQRFAAVVSANANNPTDWMLRIEVTQC